MERPWDNLVIPSSPGSERESILVAGRNTCQQSVGKLDQGLS